MNYLSILTEKTKEEFFGMVYHIIDKAQREKHSSVYCMHYIFLPLTAQHT